MIKTKSKKIAAITFCPGTALALLTVIAVIIPLVPHMAVETFVENPDTWTQIVKFSLSTFLFFCLPIALLMAARFSYLALKDEVQNVEPQKAGKTQLIK